MRANIVLCCLLSFGCVGNAPAEPTHERPAAPTPELPSRPPMLGLQLVDARVAREGDGARAPVTRLYISVRAFPAAPGGEYPSGVVAGQLRVAGSDRLFAMAGGWQSLVGTARCFDLSLALDDPADPQLRVLRAALREGRAPELRLVAEQDAVVVGESVWHDATRVLAPCLTQLHQTAEHNP